MGAGGQALVARQPVFDRALDVEAYQLATHAVTAADAFAELDESAATVRVVNDAFLDMDVRTVTAGRPALLRFPRDLLLGDTAQLLPPQLAVVLVTPEVIPDAEVVSACLDLRARGHRIGLADAVVDDPRLGTLPLDLLTFRLRADRPAAARRLREIATERRLRLVATSVDDSQDYALAREVDVDAISGGFFRGRTLVRGRRIDATRAGYLRLLALVHRPQIDLDELEEAIKQDVALAWKFLNYSNAAFFGWRQQITSIRHGLVLLGEHGARRWVSLMSVSGLAEGLPAEVMSGAVVRARFAELLAERSEAAATALEAFLAGMFSLLEAMVDEPAADVLARVSVPPAVREAIVEGAGELGELLRLVADYEAEAWEEVTVRAERLGIPSEALLTSYLAALGWASERIPE